jgi:hypothetical protein
VRPFPKERILDGFQTAFIGWKLPAYQLNINNLIILPHISKMIFLTFPAG